MACPDDWTFGWKTASKNSTASRGKVPLIEHLACLNLATSIRSGSWIYPRLTLPKHFCFLSGSRSQILKTLWDRGEKALCTWPLKSRKRKQHISTVDIQFVLGCMEVYSSKWHLESNKQHRFCNRNAFITWIHALKRFFFHLPTRDWLMQREFQRFTQ